MLCPSRQAKNTATTRFCQICGAEAKIINYGALSCHSCKTFFRRHGLRKTRLRLCQNQNLCQINTITRRFCPSCRLEKCFAMGMSSELIRKEYQRNLHPKMSSLDLLTNNRSSLSCSEWTLLSNVIHAFDRFSMVPSMRQMIESSLHCSTHTAVDICQTFHLFASFYTTVQSLINMTDDFRRLTLPEQSSLYDRNLHGLFNFSGTFMLRDAGMFDNEHNENLIVPLYGHNIVQEAKSIICRLDRDSSLVKVIEVVFAFSTNCYTVNYDPWMNNDPLLCSSLHLLTIQNFYIDILWKYMIYRYGYEESVQRFAGLIKHMLDLILLSANIYTENRRHQILVDDLVESAKIELIVGDD